MTTWLRASALPRPDQGVATRCESGGTLANKVMTCAWGVLGRQEKKNTVVCRVQMGPDLLAGFGLWNETGSIGAPSFHMT